MFYAAFAKNTLIFSNPDFFPNFKLGSFMIQFNFFRQGEIVSKIVFLLIEQ